MNAPEVVEAVTLVSPPTLTPQSIAVRQSGAVVATPDDLIRMALESGADLDRLERLMTMKERWDAGEAARAYNVAFAAFKAEAEQIIKRKRVQYASEKGTTDYKHAELADVHEALTPALSKHGLSVNFVLEQERDWLRVTCVLKHQLGHSESATLGGPPDTKGGKNPVQAIASTITMLQRQTMKAVCGVAEKGDDDDGRGGNGTDIAGLLVGLGACSTDESALAYWRANRTSLIGDQAAYDKFTAEVAAHRRTLRGDKP